MPYVDSLVEGDLLIDRHASECDHTVYMRIYTDDFVRLVKAGNKEFIANLFRRVSLEVSLIYRIPDIHPAFPFFVQFCNGVYTPKTM